MNKKHTFIQNLLSVSSWDHVIVPNEVAAKELGIERTVQPTFTDEGEPRQCYKNCLDIIDRYDGARLREGYWMWRSGKYHSFVRHFVIETKDGSFIDPTPSLGEGDRPLNVALLGLDIPIGCDPEVGIYVWNKASGYFDVYGTESFQHISTIMFGDVI